MRYFVDTDGAFLGGFDDDLPAPAGGIQVATAPDDARQVWDGAAWGAVPVTVPRIVSAFQARAALLRVGLLDEVEAIMADPETPREAVLAWEYATEFRRDSATVAAIAQQLGLDEAQLDALFIEAAGIVA